MPDASYYREQYNDKKAEAKACEKCLRELRKIASNVSDALDDEVRAVNRELSDLKQSIPGAVRHQRSFERLARTVQSAEERSALYDSTLRASHSALEREIQRLETRKERAERDRDDAYQRYQDSKKEAGSWFFGF